MTREIRPLRCAYCGEQRPDNNEDCPHCSKPRFRHKQTKEDWQQRVREMEQRDREFWNLRPS